ncbi:MAG TPA: glutaredoxin [Gallionella sp.]
MPAAVAVPVIAGETGDQAADIEIYVREGCPHCARAKEFLAKLQHEQPGLRIVIRDVMRDREAQESLKHIAAEHGVPARVPAILVGGQLIIGYSDEAGTGQIIRNLLNQHQFGQHQSGTGDYSVDFFGHSISLEQIGLPLFTLVLGLLDGFNPCSMWVLILMISLLAPLNNRPRMLAVAGTFVAVQGVAYFLFIAAWLNLFLLIGLSRISEVVIAVLALAAGTIHLKDFWRFGWGVTLSIPAGAKPGIYARMRRVLQAENLAAALTGTVLLAVLVQVVEFMCTSGFPALFTRILTLEQLDIASYYGYLLLYDLAYMLDDMAVLAVGIVMLNQRRLQENEGRWLKLVSGLVMVGLGMYLLLAP